MCSATGSGYWRRVLTRAYHHPIKRERSAGGLRPHLQGDRPKSGLCTTALGTPVLAPRRWGRRTQAICTLSVFRTRSAWWLRSLVAVSPTLPGTPWRYQVYRHMLKNNSKDEVASCSVTLPRKRVGPHSGDYARRDDKLVISILVITSSPICSLQCFCSVHNYTRKNPSSHFLRICSRSSHLSAPITPGTAKPKVNNVSSNPSG